MFLEKLRCSNCNKEIEKNEIITLKINESQLKGYTMLSNWAKSQKIFCEKCSNIK